MAWKRTEKIEELLLARMHPVLEHSSFSVVVWFRFFEPNLGLEIACQPRAAVRDWLMWVRTSQHTCNRLREHLPHMCVPRNIEELVDCWAIGYPCRRRRGSWLNNLRPLYCMPTPLPSGPSWSGTGRLHDEDDDNFVRMRCRIMKLEFEMRLGWNYLSWCVIVS